MPSPIPLPGRVLVKGASTVSSVSPMGGPRSDFAFPRVIEAELVAGGRPAEVRNSAKIGAPTKNVFRDWEQDIMQWSPDVVVIVAGYCETIHLFLPLWLERYVNRINRRPSRNQGHDHRRAVRVIWKLLATLQSKVDGPFGARILQRRLTRVASDLEGYLNLVQLVGSPLVYILELLPPSGSRNKWFPGMSDRIAFMNEQLRKVVDRRDNSEVRFLAVSEIAHSLVGEDLSAAIPDGFHYSPALHREVGRELARGIQEWAHGQPHLTSESAGGSSGLPTAGPTSQSPTAAGRAPHLDHSSRL